MDEIQKVLIKAGRKDLAQKYFKIFASDDFKDAEKELNDLIESITKQKEKIKNSYNSLKEIFKKHDLKIKALELNFHGSIRKPLIRLDGVLFEGPKEKEEEISKEVELAVKDSNYDGGRYFYLSGNK